MTYVPIHTERLILDAWCEDWRAAAAVMNADPHVMRHFVSVMDRAETDAQVDRQEAALTNSGYCFWAIIRREDRRFLGLAGLKDGAPGTPVEGEIEIGWRFDQHAWGHGYATEAAHAALAHAFSNPAVTRVGAITTLANRESWRVMERLGMTRDLTADFEHPLVPLHNPVRPHITYFISREAFESKG